jgi:hypothetical protein
VSPRTRYGVFADALRVAKGRVASALALGILVAGCAGQSLEPSGVDTGIQFLCRETDCPPGLVVEVGDQAWALSFSGGVVIVHDHNPVDVRVLDPSTCEAFADFTANPGSGWLVTFESSGSPSVQETDAYELGPAMSNAPLTGCPKGSGSAT